MKKYKIKVFFERIERVEAEDEYQARNIACERITHDIALGLSELDAEHLEEKLDLKTKALYIACYDLEDETHSNWHTFVYDLIVGDKELDRHFREVVYHSEYGETLEKNISVNIYQLSKCYDYSEQKHCKIDIAQS